MAIMTINEVAKARSVRWTGNYSLIWSGLNSYNYSRLIKKKMYLFA